MTAPTNADVLAVPMPEPKYLAKRAQSGEWLELVDADDWTAEMWAYGTEPVYTHEQLRAYRDAAVAAIIEERDARERWIAHLSAFIGPSAMPSLRASFEFGKPAGGADRRCKDGA